MDMIYKGQRTGQQSDFYKTMDNMDRIKALNAEYEMRSMNTEYEMRRQKYNDPVDHFANNEGQKRKFNENQPRIKLMFLIRTDLKMRKGKRAAQIAHAALGAYIKMEKSNNRGILEKWEELGSYIEIVKGTKQDVEQILAQWEYHDLQVHAIHDAGRTQVTTGALTVLAIGPGESKTIDEFTYDLQFLV